MNNAWQKSWRDPTRDKPYDVQEKLTRGKLNRPETFSAAS